MIVVARQLKNGTGAQLNDKTPRSVEIGPRLAERLERRAHACRRARRRILFAEPDGSYIDRTIIARRWHDPALRDAGIDMHLRLHDLRHTAAAAWLIAGKQSLEYVRRQLGHASIRQTQVYAHLERRGRGQAAAHTDVGRAQAVNRPALSEGAAIYLLGMVIIATRPGRFWLGVSLTVIPIVGVFGKTIGARARRRR